MKHYAGLDVSMKTTNICVMDERRKIIFETVTPTQPEQIFQVLQPYADSLQFAGIEAGSLSFWLIDGLRELGIPAHCLDSRKVANVLATLINKTDKNDARGIAEIVVSGFYTIVHQRSALSRDIGAIMTLRSGLVEDKVRKKNRIRGVLKNYGITIRTTGHDSFIEAVRAQLHAVDKPTRSVIEAALDDYAGTMQGIDAANLQVAALAQSNPVVRLLKTIPGVGPITALSFVAEVDDPSRFKKASSIGAYLGLTPQQYSSGESVRMGGISKAGSSHMRALLYEAALVMMTNTKSWSKLKAWGIKLSRRMPTKKAIAAVARKLAVIMLRMWQTGELFRFSDKPAIPETSPASKKRPRRGVAPASLGLAAS